MTKYYKAKIELRQYIEVEVAAETDTDARQRAKEAALQQVPGAEIWVTDLALQGETHFKVGSRIKHSLFGPGKIVELAKTTGPKKDLGFRITVNFDSGDTKQLNMPHASITPEAFGA